MYLNKITRSLVLITVATVISSTNALAQQCVEANAITSTAAFDSVSSSCCSKNTVRKQRVCIGNRINRIKRAKSALGKTFTSAANAGLIELRNNSCDSAAPVCDDSTAVTATELEDRMSAQCCSKTTSSARKRCLKNKRKQVINARLALGETAVNTMKTIHAELKASESCGAGGSEDTSVGNPSGQCGSFRSFPTGWLWKPESDVSDARGGKGVFVVNRSKPGGRTAVIVDSAGTQICTAGFKAPNEAGINCSSDHYYVGGFGCGKTGGQLASTARGNTGSSNTYLKFGSVCYGPFNPDGRKGGIVC